MIIQDEVTFLRLPQWVVAVMVIASSMTASMLCWSATDTIAVSGCTSIQDVPVTYTIEYGAAIQGLFDNFLTNGGTKGCVDCHTNPASGATGHLDLTDGISWSDLVNVPSDEDSSQIYVVPNHPEQSLLFQKINCDNPSVGGRMPRDAPNLSPEQQALIYDWIAAGAVSGTSDAIFRDGFDIRGFDQ